MIDINQTYQIVLQKVIFKIYKKKIKMDYLNHLTIHNSSRRLDELYQYLTQTCSMSEQRVQNTIKKIKQGYK